MKRVFLPVMSVALGFGIAARADESDSVLLGCFADTSSCTERVLDFSEGLDPSDPDAQVMLGLLAERLYVDGLDMPAEARGELGDALHSIADLLPQGAPAAGEIDNLAAELAGPQPGEEGGAPDNPELASRE